MVWVGEKTRSDVAAGLISECLLSFNHRYHEIENISKLSHAIEKKNEQLC